MLVTLIVLILQCVVGSHAFPGNLRITAITAVNGQSVLQCWQLREKPIISSQPGTSGISTQPLGEVLSTSYTSIPPGFNGGLHQAPVVQYVAFLSGLAHITIPSSRQEAWVRGGKDGLIIAADTSTYSDKGHITNYPSKQETVALQIPIVGQVIPDHDVLYNGPCPQRNMNF